MTIRARLNSAFVALLVLFAINLSIHFWSDQRRNMTVEELRRAIDKQTLVGSINQNLNDLQKQIALLSQVLGDEKGAEVNPDDKADVFRRIDKVKEEIQELEALSDPAERTPVTALLSDYTQLSQSWRKVYENLGINQTQAVLELVTKADPFSQRVM